MRRLRTKILRMLTVLSCFSTCLFILSCLQHTNLELEKQVMPLALKPEGLVNRLWELDKNVSHEGELVCTVCMVIVGGGGVCIFVHDGQAD